MASFNMRVVAEYDLTIDADDEDEALELAERYVQLGQETDIDVNAEIRSSDDDDEDDDY